jgi:hypothetical protein
LSGTPALRLELRASRFMTAAILSGHLAAAACLAVALPGAAGAGAGVLVLLLGAMAAWDLALLRGRRSIRALELRGDNAAVLTLADGRRLAGSVAARRNVNRWWVTLPLRGVVRRSVVVARDMLPADEFRRLRIWALWGRVAKASPRPAP